MTIAFENEIGTVLLPETASLLLDPAMARAAIERDGNVRRSHLYPLLDATARFTCSLLFAPQGCEPFETPRAPFIVVIGDDMHFAWGPKAFDPEALDGAISKADHCVLMTCGQDPWPYRIAATVAVRDRKNALLIQSLPHQQEAWRERIEAVRGDKQLKITLCVPYPEGGA